MFDFFKKKKQPAFGTMNHEEYIPTCLPSNAEPGHIDLSTCITSGLSVEQERVLEERYRACDQELQEIINDCTDSYTVGNCCDAYLHGQMKTYRALHECEVLMRIQSANHIQNARLVRKSELEDRIPKASAHLSELQAEIEPLKEKHSRYALRIGPLRIPLGLVITLLACMVDAVVNRTFLEGVLLQNAAMLTITVVCMSIMSDGTCYVLGSLLSENKKDPLRKAFIGCCAALFLLSVVGSVMIRVGSMDTTFGTINAAGDFVGKSEYSLAEYGVTLIGSFLTTCTGIISLIFSIDPDAADEERRLALETQLRHEETLLRHLRNELSALNLAEDPHIHTQRCVQNAEQALMALETGLMLHVRASLAKHQQDAQYTDSMSTSAEQLLQNPETQQNPTTIELKEVV